MKTLLTILFAFALGVQHGVGVDHLTAITALVGKQGKKARPVALSLRFGLGHMLVLFVLGGICLATKFTLPASFERAAEIFGGVLLAGLGIWLLADRKLAQLYFHKHTHAHDHIHHEHVHGHMGHEHTGEHSHLHLAAFLGGAFALSGLVRLLIIVPTVLLATTVLEGIMYIIIFGLGIILSMSLYGYLLTHFFKKIGFGDKISTIVTSVTGLASITIGLVWIGSHLM